MPDSDSKPTNPKEKLFTRQGRRTSLEVSLMGSLYDVLFDELEDVVDKLDKARSEVPDTSHLTERANCIESKVRKIVSVTIVLGVLSCVQLILLVYLVLR